MIRAMWVVIAAVLLWAPAASARLMRTPEGVVVDVPSDQVQSARDVGYKDVTPGEAAADLTRRDETVRWADVESGVESVAIVAVLLTGLALGIRFLQRAR
jgi:hypothetical protein